MATLVIVHKNGRHRKETEFAIDQAVADDPIQRAAVISAKSASITGRVVNWMIRK